MDDYNWTKDGVLVDGNDQQLEQYMSITDRHLVISQVVLSSSNRSYFQGTFQCTVRDGIGRISNAIINFNGKCERSAAEHKFKYIHETWQMK